MITGGTRSGKSRFAQEMALKLSPNPVYLATSRIWDEEHRARIQRHQADAHAQRETAPVLVFQHHRRDGARLAQDCGTACGFGGECAEAIGGPAEHAERGDEHRQRGQPGADHGTPCASVTRGASRVAARRCSRKRTMNTALATTTSAANTAAMRLSGTHSGRWPA